MSYFGPLNQRTTFGDHTMYMLDAPGLVDEDRERAAAGISYAQWAQSRPNRTVAFVQSSAQGTHLNATANLHFVLPAAEQHPAFACSTVYLSLMILSGIFSQARARIPSIRFCCLPMSRCPGPQTQIVGPFASAARSAREEVSGTRTCSPRKHRC